VKRLASIPAGWRDSVQRTIAARVDAEKRGKAETERQVRDVTARVTLDLSRLTGRRAEGAALVLVTNALPDVQRAAASGLEVTRQAARAGSYGAMGAEWAKVRAEVRQAGLAAPGAIRRPETPPGIDRAKATLAGQSYASAWGVAALAKIQDADGSFAGVAAGATEVSGWRLERAIATEASDAFQDERAAIEAAVVKRHKHERWFPALVKVWDAQLDGGRCARCASRNLTIRPWGIDFAGGDEPGRAHPNCRCVAVSVMLPIPYTESEEAA
jgi:hypothetical protein